MEGEEKSIRAELAALEVVEESDHATGWNAALREVLAVIERHEGERLKRSARAIAKRKTEGKRIGGDMPYGYELARDGETLRESPAEQRVIAAARKLRAAGRSLRDVAQHLKERGMAPRRGDQFHASQIKRMTDES